MIEASWIQKPRDQLMAVQQKLTYALSGGPERALGKAALPETEVSVGTSLAKVHGVERLPSTRLRCTLKRFWLSKAPPTFSLRKEVIQPQVLLRLPCYDFTPIMDHTLGRCLPFRGQPADF